MKMQNIALDDIVPNPWRDMKLYPIDADHVSNLRESINDHGFFGGVKGRRSNGKVEIGCGHMRIAAARKAKLESVPIYIDDLDDDTMLRLMTDENALQSGSNPGAVLNEVSAVTRRLIDGIIEPGTIVPPSVAKAFESKSAIDKARTNLRKGTDVHLAMGHNVIARYLGQGHAERSHRSQRQIREAISALKQSGRYDDIVDEVRAKYPVPDELPAKGKAVIERKPRRPRILDERVANVFPNEHQFQAFREAVTTPGAQKAIPVDQQLKLAKEIMSATAASNRGAATKKQIGATYIKKCVLGAVQDGLKKQREIDKEEREQYLAEQREAVIDEQLHVANSILSRFITNIAKMIDLAEEFPSHPKLGGFSARLDTLVSAIQQFSKKLK